MLATLVCTNYVNSILDNSTGSKLCLGDAPALVVVLDRLGQGGNVLRHATSPVRQC